MTHNFNPTSSGQQQIIPGLQVGSFTQTDSNFPTFDGEAPKNTEADSQQQVSSSGMHTDSFSFNPFASAATGASVFLPPGAIHKEEFPDLDQAFGAAQKKKKGPTKEEIEAQKKAANDLLSTKGKPYSFFVHQGWYVKPTLEQLQFVWAHYPIYSSNPHQILDWLQSEAQRIAYEEQQAKLE